MGKRIWIVIAVVLLLASGVVLGGMGLLSAVLPGVWMLAETLQQTESLDPSAYALTWWLSGLGLATILVLCVVRWARKRKGAVIGPATLPLWIYGAVHLALAWGFGLAEMAPVANISSHVMGFVLQTVELYITWVFPLLLLAIFVRALWRWAKASWIEDGRGAQIAATLIGGALLCSIGGAAALFVERGYTVVESAQPSGSGAWFSPEADRTRQLWFASMAAAPGKPEPYLQSTPQTQRQHMTFAECASRLFTQDKLKKCAQRAAKRGIPGEGEDIAGGTLVRVCEKVARDGVDELASYFGQACENAITDALKRPRTAPIDDSIDPVGWLRPWNNPPANSVEAALDCVERVAGRLSPSQRRLLELTKLGHKPRHIAPLLGEPPNTVSQRLSRLKKRLRQECQSAYRPTYRRRSWP